MYLYDRGYLDPRNRALLGYCIGILGHFKKISEFMIEILMKERYVPKIIVIRAYDKMTM